MPPQERPIGVVILAVLYLINAIVVFALVGMLVSLAGTAALVCASPFILFGIFYLLVALGLYAMKTWAWIVALVFAILGLLGAIGNLASVSTIAGSDVDIPGWFLALPAINLVLNLIIIVYLIKVKSYFR